MVLNDNTKVPDPNEGTKVPGEPDPVSEKARGMGWRPKEEWDGDPETWIDAKEFVGRQPLFDTISELKSQVWHLKKDFNQFSEYHKKVAETEYQRAVNDLKEQRKVAAKEGDTEKVVEISDRIEELRVQPPPPSAPTPAPEFTSWLVKNNWYESDRELHAAADAIGVGYKTANPEATPQQVLDHVSVKIKKTYPEKFGTTRSGNSSVEGSTPSPTRKSNTFGESDLNEIEREAMKTFVKRGVITKEKYIEEIAKSRGRS